jgi:hypothetical protein
MYLGGDFPLRLIFFKIYWSNFVHDLITTQHEQGDIEVFALVDNKYFC